MGNIGSHVDLTSGWRGHQAKTKPLPTGAMSCGATAEQIVLLECAEPTLQTPFISDEG
jgi:hypothetical protein